MKTIPYCPLEDLQSLWEELESPLFLHFDFHGANICKKSKSIFTGLLDHYSREKVLFLNVIVKENQVPSFFEDYGFVRFPALLLYDYGKIQKRWTSCSEMSESLELCIKETI